MRLDAFLISLALVTIFLIGGINIYEEQQEKYDFTYDNVLFENITKVTNELEGNITDTGSDTASSLINDPISQDDAENGLFTRAWSATKSFWSLFRQAGSLIVALGKAIGIPSWITKFILAMLGIAASWALIYLVFRFKPQN